MKLTPTPHDSSKTVVPLLDFPFIPTCTRFSSRITPLILAHERFSICTALPGTLGFTVSNEIPPGP